jgi:sirohydrochlorin cobaltochelatase
MIGIILVLHGSRVEEWKNIADGYKNLLSEHFPLVEYGFLEFNKPTLRESLEILVNKGATQIIAVPLLFAAGMHFYRDIPKLLGLDEKGETMINEKKVRVVIAKPIGVDKRIAEILKERVEEKIDDKS